MFEKIGMDVLKLQRIGIGRLKLGNLERGDIHFLSEQDRRKVFQSERPEASNMSRVKKTLSQKRQAPSSDKKSKRKFKEVFK